MKPIVSFRGIVIFSSSKGIIEENNINTVGVCKFISLQHEKLGDICRQHMPQQQPPP